MKAQQLIPSRFIVSIALLLILVTGVAVPTAAQSQPVAPAATVAFIENARLDASTRLREYDGDAGMVDQVVVLQNTYNLQGESVTKTVVPTGQVEYGDELTYTLVISAVPGVQLGLYDPLTDTTFVRFAEQPAAGVITHDSGVITGTLTVTPTSQVTVSFVVQVGVPGTVGWTTSVTNCACVYSAGGTLADCVWSNEVTNPAFRSCSIYLPLILRHSAPIQADFFAAPTSGAAPLTVVFTNTSTGGYTASLWGFGDGITSTQTSPTHTYTAAGAYTVTLTVGKAGGTLFLPGSTSTLTRANYIIASTPMTCVEGITNGGFEDDGGWELVNTPYPAGYTTATVHSGNRSMRAGIVEPADDILSHSIAEQTVTIPADTVSATLRFWLYPMSEEPPANLAPPTHPLAATIEEAVLASDRQYVLVLNEYDQWIRTLIWQRTNDQQWTFHQFDMGVHVGRTIKLQFGAYNDGIDGITAMYVDDVSLEMCPSATCARRSQ